MYLLMDLVKVQCTSEFAQTECQRHSAGLKENHIALGLADT
jgi:hypothetical protein